MSEKKGKNSVDPAEFQAGSKDGAGGIAEDSGGGAQEETYSREQKYTRQQIIASVKYRNRRDLLSAILDPDPERLYTTAEVDRMVKKFMKGKVG